MKRAKKPLPIEGGPLEAPPEGSPEALSEDPAEGAAGGEKYSLASFYARKAQLKKQKNFSFTQGMHKNEKYNACTRLNHHGLEERDSNCSSRNTTRRGYDRKSEMV